MPLNKQVTTVFLTYTTLGGYLKDRKNIEEAFSSKEVDDIQKALDTLLQNLITEVKAIDAIKGFSLDTAKNKIMESHDECVRERMGIEAAQAAEDILRAASAAAQIALVAVSWTVFGAIGLGVAALAAEVAAEGAAEGIKTLDNTIAQSISDMGLKAYNDPALANIKVYHDSTDQVSVNIAKLEVAGNEAIIRQALLGLAKTSGTAEELKKSLIHFYEVSEQPGDIIGKYQLLAELILNGDGGPKAEKVILELKESGLAPIIIKSVILSVMATGLGLAFQVRKFTNEITTFQDLGVLTLQDTAQVADLTLKSERMVKCIKGLAVLGAALETAFLGWKIYEQRKLIDYINEQIEDRKNKLIEYYTNFHEAVTSPTVDDAILGQYECHLYDQGGKNDWHYVTVSKANETTLNWANRAGVSWTLTITSDKTKLNVGQECPYYNFDDGQSKIQYRQATVVWTGSQVSGIIGPENQLYDKSAT
jgi:hypothetical protein